MHRIFVEKGVITHPQEVEEASIELDRAIKLCLAKKIFQERERDKRIDYDTMCHLRHIVGRNRNGTVRSRKTARLLIPVKDGWISMKSNAFYCWDKKLWAEDAAGDWYHHEEMTVDQQQEFHDVADSRQKELEKIMSSIGQDYISHVRAGKRLESMFPPTMGGVHQGVSTLKQQVNREDHPYQPEWTRGENRRCGAWLMDYEDMNEHDRTTLVWNQLNSIEQGSQGGTKLLYLCQLYQSLRLILELPKKNRMFELMSKFTIQLPPVGDLVERTRRMRLTHKFKEKEQEDPKRSGLCLKFLQNITDIIQQDVPIQMRTYSEEDAKLLVKDNVDQKLWRLLEDLSYNDMVNFLIMKYVQTDIQDIIVEVVGARKPLNKTWNEYLEYILSMTEMTREENEDEGQVQKQLARLIILTQLDTATRNLVHCKEKMRASKYWLSELCDYLDVNYVKELQMKAMGGMTMMTPPIAIPLIMTTASFNWNLGYLELKLQTNDHNWIGKRATLTGQYLDGIAIPLSGVDNVRIDEDFTCQIPWDSFKLPDKSYNGGRVQVGTIVAHLLGARLYQVRCPVEEETDDRAGADHQGMGDFEETGRGINVILTVAEEDPEEERRANRREAERQYNSQQENTESEAGNSERLGLQDPRELMEQAIEISDRGERIRKKLIAVLIYRLEPTYMSDRGKRVLRRKIEEVINEERSEVGEHPEEKDELLDDMVDRGERSVRKRLQLDKYVRKYTKNYS